MSPEAQRIAIAEACGYVRLFQTRLEWQEDSDSGAWQEKVMRDERERRIPDYLIDLNAMHAAEGCLKIGQWPTYEQHIREAQARQNGDSFARRFIIHATAAQRAEAFLRTIGKWEDSA